MLHLDQGLVCRLCAEARAKEAKTSGRSIQLSRIIDPTICWKCKTDYGEKDLPSIAGVPVCGTCALALYESPFPGWLKASLAALLGLLAVALWTGRPYFTAGRHLMLAERALDQSDFATASVHFGEVLKVGPTDQKVVLLGAKASILSGDPEQGQSFLNQRDSFSMDGLFAEVSGGEASRQSHPRGRSRQRAGMQVCRHRESGIPPRGRASVGASANTLPEFA
jgi:hypothetical protein